MVEPLTTEERSWLFRQLWIGNGGRCITCGAKEGYCEPESCVRLRITDKLELAPSRISA